MTGPGQSAQVILDSVSVRAGEIHGHRDGEPAVLATQIEQANRELRQTPEKDTLAFELRAQAHLLLSERAEKEHQPWPPVGSLVRMVTCVRRSAR